MSFWLRKMSWFAAAVFVLVIAAPAAETPSALLHNPAPEFVRTDLQRLRIDLRAYRGQVVLLTFWATWCAPCQTEIPRFVEWQRTLGPRGFQVVAISMDDDAPPVLRLIQKRNVNYPVVMGDTKLAELYGGVLGLPVTFLIDRRGMVAARFQGESNLEAMRKRVEELLQESSKSTEIP